MSYILTFAGDGGRQVFTQHYISKLAADKAREKMEGFGYKVIDEREPGSEKKEINKKSWQRKEEDLA